MQHAAVVRPPALAYSKFVSINGCGTVVTSQHLSESPRQPLGNYYSASAKHSPFLCDVRREEFQVPDRRVSEHSY